MGLPEARHKVGPAAGGDRSGNPWGSTRGHSDHQAALQAEQAERSQDARPCQGADGLGARLEAAVGALPSVLGGVGPARVRLSTSRYQNPVLADRLDLVKVRTTVGAPRWKLAYPLERCAAVTPYGAFGEPDWRERYIARLVEIGVDEIRRQLAEISGRHDGRDLVLLCFEDVYRDGDDACHRRAFAAWWQERTGEVVDELPPPA